MTAKVQCGLPRSTFSKGILEHDVFGGVLYPEHVGEQGEQELLAFALLIALALPVFGKCFAAARCWTSFIFTLP